MYIDAPFMGRILRSCGIHMPTFQFFRDGKKVDELELRLQGEKTFPALSAKVDRFSININLLMWRMRQFV